MQAERVLAAEILAASRARAIELVEQLRALLERASEALLLGARTTASIAVALLVQLRVGGAHDLDDRRPNVAQEAGLDAERRPCWIARRMTRRST